MRQSYCKNLIIRIPDNSFLSVIRASEHPENPVKLSILAFAAVPNPNKLRRFQLIGLLMLVSLFSGFDTAWPQNDSLALPSYQLPHTEVRQFYSTQVGAPYVLYISVPRQYHTSTQAYPVVFTLDADYAFALAHNIIEHFVDRGNLPEMIVVGIAYEGASQNIPNYRRWRTRDYTPTFTLDGGYGPEFQKYSGGGEKFRAFLETELLPFMQKYYRLKPNDRTLVGHSYGGLFGTYVLLTQPELFQRYILVSPSLWYDNKMIFTVAKAYANKNKTLPARVFFAIGEHENQPGLGRTMVVDLQELVRRLREQQYSHLELTHQVFPDETHNSVFPAALTRGLRVVFASEQP